MLSGFLITDILLWISSSTETSHARWKAIYSFYARRALRIWPAYLALLGLALIFNVQHIRDVGIWHTVFASNILFSIRNDYVPWVATPWWSLSVEEQFYLLWPLALVFSGPKTKFWLIAAALPVAVGFRVAMVATGHTGLAIDYLLPASIDALGAGAFLAWCWRRREPPAAKRLGAVGVVAAGIAVFVFWKLQSEWIAGEIALVALFALVAAAAAGIRGPLGWLLDFKPLQFIGRISFGIYLYHCFVMALLFHISRNNDILSHRGPGLFAVGGAITALVAAASWYCWEAPFNRLKVAFPYQAGSSPARRENAASRAVT